MRIAECRTCRTPIQGKGPAVQPRRLVLFSADGKAEDKSDTYRYHKKRGHEVIEVMAPDPVIEPPDPED